MRLVSQLQNSNRRACPFLNAAALDIPPRPGEEIDAVALVESPRDGQRDAAVVVEETQLVERPAPVLARRKSVARLSVRHPIAALSATKRFVGSSPN
jgi:hypothetical protein